MSDVLAPNIELELERGDIIFYASNILGERVVSMYYNTSSIVNLENMHVIVDYKSGKREEKEILAIVRFDKDYSAKLVFNRKDNMKPVFKIPEELLQPKTGIYIKNPYGIKTGILLNKNEFINKNGSIECLASYIENTMQIAKGEKNGFATPYIKFIFSETYYLSHLAVYENYFERISIIGNNIDMNIGEKPEGWYEHGNTESWIFDMEKSMCV